MKRALMLAITTMYVAISTLAARHNVGSATPAAAAATVSRKMKSAPRLDWNRMRTLT